MKLDHYRWVIASMGVLLQICLGTVYAWSYFQKPLMDAFGWANSQVAWIFSLAILFLSLGAAAGGIMLGRIGPRRMAVAGGILFSAGYLLAALALRAKSLPLLYLGYGVIGGTGLGLGYVTPVATVVKWFPDKKGFVTGMVVMGFGLGALLMSKVFAPLLMTLAHNNLIVVFGALGIVFFCLTVPVAMFMTNPPAGYVPEGCQPGGRAAGADMQVLQHSGGPLRFAMMWLFFFCNIVAGIMFIGFQSPMLQSILKAAHAAMSADRLAAYGATLIAVSSIFNGLGRFFWGGLSDRMGRIQTFRTMLGTQVIVFMALALLGNRINPWLFGGLVCYVLFCYGGGFGTMPSLVLDEFGSKLMPVLYGSILTAWGIGGIVGPQLVARITDRAPDQSSLWSFSLGAGFLLIGFLTTLAMKTGKLAQAAPPHNASVQPLPSTRSFNR